MAIEKAVAARLLANLDLGSSVAETDTLLESARVETSVFDDLLSDRVDLIPGTKGSGKTALYRIFVDFLPQMMLRSRRVVIAHGVQLRQDSVFLAYKKQFDALTEHDFVDFWCIYFVSLAYEQFIKNPAYAALLSDCATEIASFQAAYRKARIPDFDRKKTLKEIIAWALGQVSRLKPTVTWKPPEDAGQLEFVLDVQAPAAGSAHPESDPRMPIHVEALALALEQLLRASDLHLWLMVDRLDELFARRSDTEKRALRGLLRTLRLIRSDRVRIKVFLRDDILEHIVKDEGFTALTHVIVRKSDTLRWSEDQILSMIVKRLSANPGVREFLELDQDRLATSPDYQRRAFYRVFSDTVYRREKHSPTLRWIYNHTKDGRGVVTPRDVIDLLVRANQKQRDDFRRDPEGTTDRLIHGPAIIHGLDELSRDKRVSYLEAEFPHKWEQIRILVGGGTEYSERALRSRCGKHADKAIEDLVSIGVLYRASKSGEPTYRVPFLYRRGLECTQRFVA